MYHYSLCRTIRNATNKSIRLNLQAIKHRPSSSPIRGRIDRSRLRNNRDGNRHHLHRPHPQDHASRGNPLFKEILQILLQIKIKVSPEKLHAQPRSLLPRHLLPPSQRPPQLKYTSSARWDSRAYRFRIFLVECTREGNLIGEACSV